MSSIDSDPKAENYRIRNQTARKVLNETAITCLALSAISTAILFLGAVTGYLELLPITGQFALAAAPVVFLIIWGSARGLHSWTVVQSPQNLVKPYKGVNDGN